MRPRIIFHVGGTDIHPSAKQARHIIEWLGEDYLCHTAESLAAFEHVNECDLLVLMGQHWTGLKEEYRSPSETHRKNFEKYVQSGKPLLTAHAAICSYDDWPRFGELVGFTWVWGTTSHSPLDEYPIHVINTGHPIVAGVNDFSIHDELYYDIRITSDMDLQVHAQSKWQDRNLPMVMTAEGGRIAGAGKTAYLANGHDMQSFQNPAMQKLWMNAVKWCLAEK
jgi:type 1 glutamine amidotransferase